MKILWFRNECIIKRTMTVDVYVEKAKERMNDHDFQKKVIDKIEVLEFRAEINENAKI